MNKKFVLKFIFVVLLKLAVKNELCLAQSVKENATGNLEFDLLSSYDKYALPTESVISVDYDLEILRYHVEEKNSILRIYCIFLMVWTDPQLTWNPGEYNDTDVIYLQADQIWHPEIYIFGALDYDYDAKEIDDIVLWSSGSTLWELHKYHNITCDFNSYHWPYDEQQCSFRFGSIAPKVQLKYVDKTPRFTIENDEWKLQEIKIEYKKLMELSDDLRFETTVYTIKLKRYSSMLHTIIVAPGVVFSLIILASFFIPKHRNERIILNLIIASIIIMYLLYLTDTLSLTSSATPLIVLFYNHSLLMVALSIIISIIVMNLSRMDPSTPIPQRMNTILQTRVFRFFIFDRLLKMNNVQTATDYIVHSSDDDEHEYIVDEIKDNQINQWEVFAHAVNRIGFVMYSLIFLYFTVRYL